MIKIKAMGVCLAAHGMTPEEYARNAVADMLRYDDGTITNLELVERPNRPGVYRYTAYIACEHYTPERWDSFLIPTERLTNQPTTAPYTGHTLTIS